MQYLANSTKARTAVGKEEDCLPGYQLQKGASSTSIAQKKRVDGTGKKKNIKHDVYRTFWVL